MLVILCVFKVAYLVRSGNFDEFEAIFIWDFVHEISPGTLYKTVAVIYSKRPNFFSEGLKIEKKFRKSNFLALRHLASASRISDNWEYQSSDLENSFIKSYWSLNLWLLENQCGIIFSKTVSEHFILLLLLLLLLLSI